MNSKRTKFGRYIPKYLNVSRTRYYFFCYYVYLLLSAIKYVRYKENGTKYYPISLFTKNPTKHVLSVLPKFQYSVIYVGRLISFLWIN